MPPGSLPPIPTAQGQPAEPPEERPAEELPPPRVALTWGSQGHGEGQFDLPIAVALNPRGEVLVTDFRQSNSEARARLQRFDPDGRYLASFELDPMPGGLAVDPEGLIYASHMMRHKISIYDPDGRVVREFGQEGSGPGQFQQPGGIALGPDGTVYVADQVNRRVQRFSPTGELIAAWGRYGVGAGEFGGNTSPQSRVGGPHFLAFDRQGRLYTTEGSVGRVQQFRADGTFLTSWGDNRPGPGHFGGGSSLQGPIAIAVDGQDRVWVTSTNHLVQQFTNQGSYLRGIGGEGSQAGQFRLPHGIACDGGQALYVADARNFRIQKLEI